MTEQSDITPERILRALERSGGNRRRAAEMLGVGRATLYRWIERYGISADVLKRVGGRYQVVRLLGEGSQATVYLVRDRTGKLSDKALKLLHTEHLSGEAGEAAQERLRQEYRALSLLRHPGLVRVHDFGIDDATSRPFLVMDLVRGRPFVAAASGRPPEWIARALEMVIEAVDHLHRRGLVHRDLKSENVLVEPGESTGAPASVTVMDLGLSEDLAGPSLSPGGTFLYAAPEVLAGGRASSRSDLYALGVMTYIALTGTHPQRPVAGDGDSAPAGPVRPAPSSTLAPGVPPELDALLARMLDPDPAHRFPDAAAVVEELHAWIGATGAGARDRTGDEALELVGRDAELEAVLEIVDRRGPEGEEPRSQSLVLVGAAGVGKSRFLDACLDELRARGWRVASAACRPGGNGGPAVVGEILVDALSGADGRGSSAEDRLLDRHRASLAPIVPRVYADLAAEEAATGGASRFHALDVIATFVSELAEIRPQVIALDDLHLADPFVLELVWMLARRAQKRPLRLLATTKTVGDPAGDLESMLQGATTEGLLQLMPLEPLDPDAVRRMAENHLGVARAAFFSDRLWTLTSGNPLFLHELLREIAETGARAVPDEEIRLPDNAREVTRARWQRVGSDGRRMLEALAVAGRPERPERLAELSSCPLGSPLHELMRRQMVTALADGKLDLASDPLRQIVLEETTPATRRDWHVAWAELLRGDPDAAVDRARHLIAAGAGPELREEILDAARRRHRGWHYGEAIRFYEEALDRFPQDDPERLAIFPELELACREAHDREHAADVCRRWSGQAERVDDAVAAAHARSYLAANLRELRQWDAALEAAETAIELAERSGEGRVISLANKSLALVQWVSWRKRDALRPLERSLELARTSRDTKGQAYTLQDVGLLHAVIGMAQRGLDEAEESRRLFAESGDEAWSLLARSNEALILAYLGDGEGAIDLLRETIAGLESLSASVPLEAPLENLVLLLNRLGHYTEALETGQRLVDDATRWGRHGHRLSGLLALGDAMFHLDERDNARDHHKLAEQLAVALGESRQRLFASLARARDLRCSGRPDAAAERAEGIHAVAVRERAVRQRALAAVELAKTALERDEPAVAQRWLDDAESAMQAPCEDGPAIRARILLERSRAWTALGRMAFAESSATEGLALAEHRGPVDVEIRLAAQLARLREESGDDLGSARAYRHAASRIQQIAERLDDPARRARYVGRPDLAALLAAAERRAPLDPLAGIGAPGHADTLANLYEVSRKVAAGGELDPLFERIVEVAVSRTGAERGLLLVRQTDGSVRPAASVGLDEEAEPDAIRISTSALARADRGGALLVTDAQRDPSLNEAASVAMFGIRSIMCAPVRMGDEILGSLYVDTQSESGLFSHADLSYLEALAAQAAISLAYGEMVGRLSRERKDLERTAVDRHSFAKLIGRSEAMQKVFDLLERVADTDVPVMIQGESGTGKELAAKALHFSSRRREKPFQSENCAALPDTLLESTLFGHVKGAFTGADRDRPGLFELAHGGSLFLDEVGDMSPSLQAKLLRVLQEKEFRPVGGSKLVRSDVRVITATHRDLPAMVKEGGFRQDLFFRLNGVTVALPPLCDRREDVPLLVQHFLEEETKGTDRAPPRVSPAVLRVLVAHDWPGNVRELQNAVKRLVLFTEGDRVEIEALDADPDLGALAGRRDVGAAGPGTRGSHGSDPQEVRELRRALDAAGGKKDEAAALLGISRATLYRRLKRHGLVGGG